MPQNDLEKRVAYLEGVISSLVKSDRYTIERTIQLLDGRNFQFATGTGTKIGTAASQKIAFWGTTPVDQPAAIADVAGGLSDSDGTARAKINSVIAALREVGIIAT